MIFVSASALIWSIVTVWSGAFALVSLRAWMFILAYCLLTLLALHFIYPAKKEREYWSLRPMGLAREIIHSLRNNLKYLGALFLFIAVSGPFGWFESGQDLAIYLGSAVTFWLLLSLVLAAVRPYFSSRR